MNQLAALIVANIPAVLTAAAALAAVCLAAGYRLTSRRPVTMDVASPTSPNVQKYQTYGEYTPSRR